MTYYASFQGSVNKKIEIVKSSLKNICTFIVN